MLKTFRAREDYCVEFTMKEEGRPMTVYGGEISQVVKLADGSAGILLHGRTGYTPLVESYEAVRDAVFPVIEEIFKRKTEVEIAENARFTARLKMMKEHGEAE